MTTENDNTLDVQTARKIRDLFGPCSSLYECHTIEGIIADYTEMVAKNPATTLEYWIGIQLSVEDAFGTPSEMITDIRNRLRPYWTPVTERQGFVKEINKEIITSRGQVSTVCFYCGVTVTRGTDYPADADDACFLGNDPGALEPYVTDSDGYVRHASFVEECRPRDLRYTLAVGIPTVDEVID